MAVRLACGHGRFHGSNELGDVTDHLGILLVEAIRFTMTQPTIISFVITSMVVSRCTVKEAATTCPSMAAYDRKERRVEIRQQTVWSRPSLETPEQQGGTAARAPGPWPARRPN